MESSSTSRPSRANLVSGVLMATLAVALYLYWLTGPILDLSQYFHYGTGRWYNYRMVDSGNRLIYFSQALEHVTSIDINTGECKHIPNVHIESLDLVNQQGECAVRTKNGVTILDLRTGATVLQRDLPDHWEIKRLHKHQIVVERTVSSQQMGSVHVQVAVINLDDPMLPEIAVREIFRTPGFENNYLFLRDDRLFFAGNHPEKNHSPYGYLYSVDGQSSHELSAWPCIGWGERLDWVQRSSDGILTQRGQPNSRNIIELRSIETGQLLVQDVTPDGYFPPEAGVRPSYLKRASISWRQGRVTDFVKLEAITPAIIANGALPTSPPCFFDTRIKRPWIEEYNELIDINEDGSLALFGGTGFACTVVDVPKAQKASSFSFNFKRDVSFAALAPKNRMLFVHWNNPIDYCVKIHDARTGKLHRTIRPLMFWQLLLASAIPLAITSTVLLLRQSAARNPYAWSDAVLIAGTFTIAVLMRFEIAFYPRSESLFAIYYGFLGGCLHAVIAGFVTLCASAINFGRGRFAVKFFVLELLHLTIAILCKDVGLNQQSAPQNLQQILYAFPLLLLILFICKLIGVHTVTPQTDYGSSENETRQFSMTDILLMMTAVSLFLFVASPFSMNFNSNLAVVVNNQLVLYLVPICLTALYCGFSRHPRWIRISLACLIIVVLLAVRHRYIQSRNFAPDLFMQNATLCIATGILTWLMVLPFRFRGVRLGLWRCRKPEALHSIENCDAAGLRQF